MVSRNEIQTFVDDVIRQFRPQEVILFGSYAYGIPTRDSDVDLLVVMEHEKSALKAALDIRLTCPRQFPLDLIVRSPAYLRDRLAHHDSFHCEIFEKGERMYERRSKKMGRKSGSRLRRCVIATTKS